MSWFKLFRANYNSKFRLFCFHYGGGSASSFQQWIKDLHPDADLIAIQLPGREDRFNEPLLSDISIIVEELSSSIKNYLDKPFIFFGHSIGAIIAFELARGLRRKEMNQPRHLIVSGAGDPRISLARENIHHLSDSQFIEELKKYNGIPLSVLENKELINLFLSIIRADFSILENYKYYHENPLDCRITALGGTEDNTFNFDNLLKWESQTTNLFSCISLAGDHFFIRSAYKKVIQIVNNILKELEQKNIV